MEQQYCLMHGAGLGFWALLKPQISSLGQEEMDGLILQVASLPPLYTNIIRLQCHQCPLVFSFSTAREGAARDAFTLLKRQCLHRSSLNSSNTSISAWFCADGSTGHLAEAAEHATGFVPGTWHLQKKAVYGMAIPWLRVGARHLGKTLLFCEPPGDERVEMCRPACGRCHFEQEQAARVSCTQLQRIRWNSLRVVLFCFVLFLDQVCFFFRFLGRDSSPYGSSFMVPNLSFFPGK